MLRAAGSVCRLLCLTPFKFGNSVFTAAALFGILGSFNRVLFGSMCLLPLSSGGISENFLEARPDTPFCRFFSIISDTGSLIMLLKSVSSSSSSASSSPESAGESTTGATSETKTTEAVFLMTRVPFGSPLASFRPASSRRGVASQRMSWQRRQSEHLWHQPSSPISESSARHTWCLHRLQLVRNNAGSVKDKRNRCG